MRYLPAEWEKQSAVQLTFPHKNSDWADVLDEVMPCFIQIAEAISRFQKVLIVCQDQKATAALLQNAVTQNLRLVECDSNDTWARDHGGITVFENGKPIVLDFVFNGWGLKFPAYKDNLITKNVGSKDFFHAKILNAGIVMEGGGIETDGKGTLLSTTECMLSPNRNPHLSIKKLEQKLSSLLGVDHFLWLNHGYLAGDDTDSHIDTLARFCDEQTIAYVQCLDKTDEHYAALVQMEQELKAFRNKIGQPYRLVALPMAAPCYASDGHRLPATYANFLIINEAVLVPIYKVAQDEAALNIFKEIFPDREIIAIDCRALILQHGSLHCVTMQYPEGVVA